MNRRAFIAGLGGAAAWPVLAEAQPSTKRVIGFLGSTSPQGAAAPVRAVREGLKQSGINPEDVEFEFQFAQGHYDQLPALASELVRKNVAVIVASGSANAGIAAKNATSSIPIVFLNGSDPVAIGLVQNISRPDGNTTGVTTFTNLGAKRLELFRELLPKATSFFMLINPNSAIIEPEVDETHAAALGSGLQLEVLNARTAEDIERAFELLAQKRAEGVIVGSDPFFASEPVREKITALAARNLLPAIYQWREFVEAGGLISYGTRLFDGYRQAGVYVGRILNGAKPADLPVMFPTAFEMAINLNTAKALALDIPPTVLARADEVIE